MKDYWQSEYENLRRKKIKEVNELKYKYEEKVVQANQFIDKTMKLLHLLGMNDKDIKEYYGKQI